MGALAKPFCVSGFPILVSAIPTSMLRAGVRGSWGDQLHLRAMPGWVSVAAGIASIYFLMAGLGRRGILPPDRSVAVLLTAVAAGCFTVTVTELASLFEGLRPAVLALAWTMLSVAAILTGMRLRRGAPGLGTNRREPAPDRFSRAVDVVSISSWCLLLPVAILIPQVNLDVQTYHLPRVWSWLQQGSLAPYPTADYRALDFAPFGGMLLANILSSGRGELFAGLSQWMAAGGCLAAASLLGQSLCSTSADDSSRRRAGAVARAFVATIPLAVLQATTAQNDLLATFWLLSAVALGVVALRHQESTLLVAGASAALALALLTKETVAFFAMPFLVFLGVASLRRRTTFGRLGRWVVTLGLAFGVLHSGHLLRRWAVFGSPIGSGFARETLLSADVSLPAVASSILRNLSLYSATGSPGLTAGLHRGFLWLHGLTGRDLNDPDTTYGGAVYPRSPRLSFGDARANVPSSVAAVLLSGLLLVGWKAPERSRVVVWMLLVLAGGVAFSAVVRWQLFNVRFHLPGLALFAPAVGVVLSRRLGRIGLGAVLVVLFGSAALAVVLNESGPFGPITGDLRLPREKRAFAQFPENYEEFLSATYAVRLTGCREVGFALAFLEQESVLWTLLGEPAGPLRLQYAGPNSLVDRVDGTADPCLLLTSVRAMPDETLPYLPFHERAPLPDRARFGGLRLLLSPASSGRFAFARPVSDGSMVPLRVGSRLEVGPEGVLVSVFTFRPGSLAIELLGEDSVRAASVEVRNGAFGWNEVRSDGASVLLRADVPGGANTIHLRSRGESGRVWMQVVRLQFDTADDAWSGIRLPVQSARSEPGRVLDVGPIARRVDLLSRKGGALRLTGGLEPRADHGSGDTLVVESPEGQKRVGVPGRLDLVFRTGRDVFPLTIRSTGGGIALRDPKVELVDVPGRVGRPPAFPID